MSDTSGKRRRRMVSPRGADARWLLGLGLAAGAACGGQVTAESRSGPGEAPDNGNPTDAGAAPTPTAVPTVPPDPTATPPDPDAPPCATFDDEGDLAGGPLSPFALTHEQVGRRLIYSWTTAEQIAELREDPTLLTRSMTSDGDRGRAADTILSRADFDEMAAILAGPEFEKKRFGWANPWATLLGWAGESYGRELLAIRLRSEAWIGRFDAETGAWAFFDVDNQPVSLDAVQASPERIAAVYYMDGTHSQECRWGTWGGTFGGTAAFREYFLCNEAMIEGWSAYTTEIRGELERGIAALTELRALLASGHCAPPDEDLACWRASVVEAWTQVPRSLVQAYEAALAFPNDLYYPSVEGLDHLLADLQDVLFVPAPLVHENLSPTDAGP
jgi:hypothetical protein